MLDIAQVAAHQTLAASGPLLLLGSKSPVLMNHSPPSGCGTSHEECIPCRRPRQLRPPRLVGSRRLCQHSAGPEARPPRKGEPLFAEDELVAPNFVYHDPASGEDWHGLQSVKRYAAMMHAASRLFTAPKSTARAKQSNYSRNSRTSPRHCRLARGTSTRCSPGCYSLPMMSFVL